MSELVANSNAIERVGARGLIVLTVVLFCLGPTEGAANPRRLHKPLRPADQTRDLIGCWRQKSSPFPKDMDGILACFDQKHKADVSVGYHTGHRLEIDNDIWDWYFKRDRIYITAGSRTGGRVTFSCRIAFRAPPNSLFLGKCRNMETTRAVSGAWKRVVIN